MTKNFLKIENLFFILCFLWGLLFLFVNPPFQAPDEPEHLFKMWGYTQGSYNYKIKNGWAGQILPESFSALYKVYDTYRMSNNPVPFDVTLQASLVSLDKNNTEFLRFTPSSYTPVSYFPSFIVLWILKIINISPLFMIYILRFCSLLMYLALCYFAIKLAPVKKLLFFTCAMIPVCVCQAASISTDGITFGVIFLFMAYTFRLAFDDTVEKINRKAFLYWAGLVVLIGVLKFSYLPLCLVYFLIPQKKFDFCKNGLKFFAGVLVLSAAVSLIVVLPAVNTAAITRYGHENNLIQSGEVVKNILFHPLWYFSFLLKSLIKLSGFLLQNMISSIGVTLAMIPSYTVCFCWFCLFAAAIYKQEEEVDFKITAGQKTVVLAGIVLSVLLIFTAVYVTYQSSDYIKGVQGRYLTPLILFVLLLFSNNRIKFTGAVVKVLLILSVQYVLFVNLMMVINRYY